MSYTTYSQQKGRQGNSGTSRFDFLQALVTEFSDSSNTVAKEQIVANLGNFAYDPFNYDHFLSLCIPDLFLDIIDEGKEDTMIQLAMGGICNCCLGRIAAAIEESDGHDIIVSALSQDNEETVASAITAMYYLISKAKSKLVLLSTEVLDCMTRYASSHNVKLKNLATCFLQEAAPYLEGQPDQLGTPPIPTEEELRQQEWGAPPVPTDEEMKDWGPPPVPTEEEIQTWGVPPVPSDEELQKSWG